MDEQPEIGFTTPLPTNEKQTFCFFPFPLSFFSMGFLLREGQWILKE